MYGFHSTDKSCQHAEKSSCFGDDVVPSSGVVLGLSSLSTNWGWVPCRIILITKNGMHSFPAWHSTRSKYCLKEKPPSSLFVSLRAVLIEISP